MASLFFADGSVPPAGFIQMVAGYNASTGWDPIQAYLDNMANAADPTYVPPPTDEDRVNVLINAKISTLVTDVAALKSGNNQVTITADLTTAKADIVTIKNDITQLKSVDTTDNASMVTAKADITKLQTDLQASIYDFQMGLYNKADASRMDQVESTLALTSASAQYAEGFINEWEQSWTTTKQKADGAINRLDAMDTTQTQVEQSISALQTTDNNQASNIQGHADRLYALELAKIAMQGDQTTMSNRLTNIANDVTQNYQTLTFATRDITNAQVAITALQAADVTAATRMTANEAQVTTLKAVADDVQLRMYYNDFRRIAYISVGDVGGSGSTITTLTVQGWITGATKQVGSPQQSVITINWVDPGYQLVPMITAFNDYNTDPNNSANNDMSAIFLHKQSLTRTQAKFLVEKNGTNFSVNLALYVAFIKFQ